MPSILASPSDVPQWNKRTDTYFDILFAFASANLHDIGVLVFAHSADPEDSTSIHNWAHTKKFYVAEDWFGMNDLDLLLPTNLSELVIPYLLHPLHLVLCFFHLYSLDSTVHFLFRLASFSSRCLFVMNLF